MNAASAGRRVLILGGTSEARALAAALDQAGVAVVSSLAGRTAKPRLPVGEVHFGGFGGAEGLARWVVDHSVVAVIDATHPFAERISSSAAVACVSTDVPLCRLERPPWRERPGDTWHRVADLAEAAGRVSSIGRRAWLTIGRQGVAAFAEIRTCWFLIRCIEPPDPPLPPDHRVLLDRGPYTVAGEEAILDRHAIDVLVTKESGGSATEAKLEAARRRQLPVVVVRRPPARADRIVERVAEATAWALSVLEAATVRMGPPQSR